MTRPQAEPSAQALGESLAALAVQVAALRGQVTLLNQRLDRGGLRGDLDLAARFEELAQTFKGHALQIPGRDDPVCIDIISGRWNASAGHFENLFQGHTCFDSKD